MAARASATAVRERQLPAAGVWEIDTAHSSVGAVARHLMVAKVRGHFSRFNGTVTIGATPEESSVVATIDAASIDTADERRDAHLRSPDFLDVENYPTLEFRSTKVTQTGEATLQADGDLTIRGVTRPVSLAVEYLGLATDPYGRDHAVFSASTEIDREKWGMTWNAALETGGVLVGPRFKIELDIQAIKQA